MPRSDTGCPVRSDSAAFRHIAVDQRAVVAGARDGRAVADGVHDRRDFVHQLVHLAGVLLNRHDLRRPVLLEFQGKRRLKRAIHRRSTTPTRPGGAGDLRGLVVLPRGQRLRNYGVASGGEGDDRREIVV